MLAFRVRSQNPPVAKAQPSLPTLFFHIKIPKEVRYRCCVLLKVSPFHRTSESVAFPFIDVWELYTLYFYSTRSLQKQQTLSQHFVILFNIQNWKKNNNHLLLESFEYRSTEPVGSRAPTLSTNLRSSTVENVKLSSFTLPCQAQGYPSPDFRWVELS